MALKYAADNHTVDYQQHIFIKTANYQLRTPLTTSDISVKKDISLILHNYFEYMHVFSLYCSYLF